ncbi:N-formylglutamate amidohydrolase [Ovoidimarina sediminis]|uniref:N-formylglutamate amidohydrolase n=1 Tax=Ovoidimarina sediminis TaxID=3079856 RepID=UPI002907068A|nr:N-formylglutamate amidohydrolase [Rhodophyticola sp. MJ-SS7]MDU8944181.1 N-formylglutamate amidohydrolase [Rhodophyticola sp. MJ-SS7]
MQQTDRLTKRLLDPGADPAPVEDIAPARPSSLLFVCEHAGRAVPQALGDLGLSPREMDRHIAWDIGAEPVARRLASAVGARLVLQRYSRLVIDCNRPPLGTGSIPGTSDGTTIPGNLGLSDDDKSARVAEIFEPFAGACSAAAADPGIRAAYSIHSFTPTMNGRDRPWHIGFCARQPDSGASELAERFRLANPDLTVAVNEPYQIDDETDWFIPRVAEPRGVLHALIEIRNDLIASPEGQALWGDWLADLFLSMPETSP